METPLKNNPALRVKLYELAKEKLIEIRKTERVGICGAICKAIESLKEKGLLDDEYFEDVAYYIEEDFSIIELPELYQEFLKRPIKRLWWWNEKYLKPRIRCLETCADEARKLINNAK